MGILGIVFALFFLMLISPSCTHRDLQTDYNIQGHHTSQINSQRQTVCQEVPPRVLRQVLGSAYNDHYMSFEEPLQDRSKRNNNHDNRTVVDRPFFVNRDLEAVLSEEPAWNVDFAEDPVSSNPVPVSEGSVPAAPIGGRERRKTSNRILDAIALSGDTHFKWHCEAPPLWKDLGQDYFPRYIQTVDCNHRSCRGTRFQCEPRSFAIKVLRRRQGVCAPGFKVPADTLQIGSGQMPPSLSQLWVWEVRAISFCCVCQYK